MNGGNWEISNKQQQQKSIKVTFRQWKYFEYDKITYQCVYV